MDGGALMEDAVSCRSPEPPNPPTLPERVRRRATGWLLSILVVLPAVAEEKVVLLHPSLVSGGQLARPSSLLTFDPASPGPAIAEQVLGLPIPMGLALDSDGVAHVGSVTIEPLRVELLRRPEGEGPPSTFGTVIDSSLQGFIDFIGVDFAIRGQSLYLIEGRQRDQQLATVRGSRILRIDLSTAAREVIWQSDVDLSGLAVDERGYLYVGVIRLEPLTVELIEIRPDGVRRSLGNVFDSSPGFTFARPFQLAAGGGQVVFLHSRVFSGSEQTLVEESLRRIDPSTLEVEVLFETPDSLDGLAVDSAGRVFFGRTRFDPFRLELLRRAPDGTIDSYGQAIDSSGSSLELLKIHLAAVPAALQGTCRRDETTLCFHDGRFEVRGSWTTAGASGAMRRADLGRRDSSALYFFVPDNLELLIKILDACETEGRYWMFYSATTDVGFELQVRDTLTGIERVYTNPLGSPAQPTFDTATFLCGDS